MTAREVCQAVASLSPPLGGEEGFRYGDEEAEVSGVLICWMATMAALRQAVAEGCNLVVCHEDLFFPYAFLDPAFEKHITWPVNRARIKVMAEHDLVVYRSHSTLDRALICDEFSRALGLGESLVREYYYRLHEIAPTTLGDLAQTVKGRLSLPTVRVTGDLAAPVSRIGLAVGGTGLSVNVGFLNGLLAYKPDVIVTGEADEYAMRFVVDAGVPMLETGHAASENPGLRTLTTVLQERFPDLRVVYFECDRPWVAV
jgi:putative NIF3 family GTP cyclohydrolase 1 type 2